MTRRRAAPSLNELAVYPVAAGSRGIRRCQVCAERRHAGWKEI